MLNVLQIGNPSVAALYEDALVYETGSAITSTGALTAYSGAKTGRSPLDKRIVKEPGSEKDVWWGPVNKPMTPEVSTPPLDQSFILLLHGECCWHSGMGALAQRSPRDDENFSTTSGGDYCGVVVVRFGTPQRQGRCASLIGHLP